MRISTEKREARREFLEQRELFFWLRDMYTRLEASNVPVPKDRAGHVRAHELETVAKARKLHHARRFRPVIVR